MKGKLKKLEYNEWVMEAEDGAIYILHPDDVEEIHDAAQVFDNIEARIAAYPDEEFYLMQHQKLDGIAIYAKIIKPETK